MKLYHLGKYWKSVWSIRDIIKSFDKVTISKSQVEKAKFRLGDTNLEDEKERSRISNFDYQSLLVTMEENKDLTTRILA